jgi:DNA repair photolyase
VHVNVSVTTLDAELARALEPRTSAPSARLRAITALAAAGVPTRVMVAPIIPGLNDEEIPAILRAASNAGAQAAAYILLRLPLAVGPIFVDWLRRKLPLRASRIEGLIRHSRDGVLSSSEWGTRMRGKGRIAEQIERVFEVFARKHRLSQALPPYDFTQFRKPGSQSQQLSLFDDP